MLSTQTEWRQPRSACTQWVPQQGGLEEDDPAREGAAMVKIKALLDARMPLIAAALEQNGMLNVFVDDFARLPTPVSLALGPGDDSQLKEFQSCKYMGFDRDHGVTRWAAERLC